MTDQERKLCRAFTLQEIREYQNWFATEYKELITTGRANMIPRQDAFMFDLLVRVSLLKRRVTRSFGDCPKL